MLKRRGRDFDGWREDARPVFGLLLNLGDAFNVLRDAAWPDSGEMDLSAANEALAALFVADRAFHDAFSSWATQYASTTGLDMAKAPGPAATYLTLSEAYMASTLSILAFLGSTRYAIQVEADGKLEDVERCYAQAVEWYNSAAKVAHRIIDTGHSGDDSQLEAYRTLSLSGAELYYEFHDYLDGLRPP